MRVQQAFDVPAPLDQVWDAFLDVPGVVPCLPGAQLLETLPDDRFAGRVTVRLGPMSFSFEGQAAVTADAATRTGTIEGKGSDRKGGSRGSVRVVYTLTHIDAAGETGSGTRVALDTDLTLAGPAAQFGRTGLIEEVSRRLLAEFATCLGARLAASTPEEAAGIRAPEVGAATLLMGAVTDRLRRGIRG
jgi:carbon monoxide dehydrogenase subunit G